jgi:hypothetical protein
VLTLPRSGTSTKEEFVVRHSPKLLFCMPLSVQAFVIWNDIRSMSFGMSISLNNTMWSFVLSGVCLAMLIALTIICLVLARSIDREWNEWTVEVYPGPVDPQGVKPAGLPLPQPGAPVPSPTPPS